MMTACMAVSLLAPLASQTTTAQSTSTSFSSGSTGADGAFAPTASQQVQLPDSGIFNFTTVTVPAGVAITFKRNAKNTSVTILASGDVSISGLISVDGSDGGTNGRGPLPGPGGPGGFDGGPAGAGFSGNLSGLTGNGPGAGGGGGGGTSSTAAGIGGGAGTGTVLATKGKEIHYSPETRITFSLARSVEV